MAQLFSVTPFVYEVLALSSSWYCSCMAISVLAIMRVYFVECRSCDMICGLWVVLSSFLRMFCTFWVRCCVNVFRRDVPLLLLLYIHMTYQSGLSVVSLLTHALMNYCSAVEANWSSSILISYSQR